jgi:hypothetical protein
MALNATQVVKDFVSFRNAKLEDIARIETHLGRLDEEYYQLLAQIDDNSQKTALEEKYKVEHGQLLKMINKVRQAICSQEVQQKSIFDQINSQIEHMSGQKEEQLLQRTKRFNRIKIIHKSTDPRLPRPQERTIEVTPYFADLRALVQSLFPDFLFELQMANTNIVVGSQTELECAYFDAAEGATCLELEIILEPNKKRDREEDIASDGESEVSVVNEGAWCAAEVELFKDGLRLFGDEKNKWSKIAKTVGTRNRYQTRNFAKTLKGKRLMVSMPSFTQIVADAVSAQKDLAVVVNRIQRQETDDIE